MEYSFLPFSDSIADEWDALVKSSPDGFMFATSSWLSAVKAYNRSDWEDHSFALFQDQKIVGVMLLCFVKTSNCMVSHVMGSCGPVVAAINDQKKRKNIIEALLCHAEELALQLKAQAVTFWTPSFCETSYASKWGVNPFCEFGYEDCSMVTRIVDLTKNETELWKECSRITHRKVKEAETAGFSWSICNWPDEIDLYYALHVETYTRTGVKPHPKSYFEAIANIIAKKGYNTLFACYNPNKKVIGYYNIAHMNNMAIGHTACSTDESLENGGNYFLWWHALLYLKKIGIERYEIGELFPGEKADIWGTGKKYGLTVFKSKFGGEDHRCFHCRKILPQIIETNKTNEILNRVNKKQAVIEFLRSGKRLFASFTNKGIADFTAKLFKIPIHFFLKIYRFPRSINKKGEG